MARVYIREKKLKDGKVSLRLDYYLHGERRIETLNLYITPADKKSRDQLKRRTYEEVYINAEYLRNKKEQQLITDEHDLPLKVDKKASFIEYFDKLATKRNHNWQSVRKHLIAFSNGRLAFGNINEEWLSRFQDYLQEHIKDVTVCSYIGVITTCLNHALRDKIIAINPSNNIKKVRGKELPPKYLPDEKLAVLEAMSSELPGWFTDAFFFSCYTGLRLSDVETLTWNDIEYTTDTHGNSLVSISKMQVKTQEMVRVPLSEEAEEILNRQALGRSQIGLAQERVFNLKSRTTTKRYIERWRKLTGFHFTYHSSRHTFGTMLQSSGVDINTTSKLMGHKSLEMTLRYAKVVNRAREEAITKLNSYRRRQR
ncbi:site-specific integrase [Hymenobacter sp. BT491]|uniref:site-specific integrase n=1 Tax=Hymenobacter sp. BT491 TaxID=2766779 RepID=UPI0016534DCD|nr:site-specific integrase [Hymenobacter sp. BT491]MBC6992272.1 site-specific integrase [Hymenobacter sp. BT491]